MNGPGSRVRRLPPLPPMAGAEPEQGGMNTGLSEKQKEIFRFGNSGYDALICDGAIRTGKSSLMTAAFVDWACPFSVQPGPERNTGSGGVLPGKRWSFRGGAGGTRSRSSGG